MPHSAAKKINKTQGKGTEISEEGQSLMLSEGIFSSNLV